MHIRYGKVSEKIEICYFFFTFFGVRKNCSKDEVLFYNRYTHTSVLRPLYMCRAQCQKKLIPDETWCKRLFESAYARYIIYVCASVFESKYL